MKMKRRRLEGKQSLKSIERVVIYIFACYYSVYTLVLQFHLICFAILNKYFFAWSLFFTPLFEFHGLNDSLDVVLKDFNSAIQVTLIFVSKSIHVRACWIFQRSVCVESCLFDNCLSPVWVGSNHSRFSSHVLSVENNPLVGRWYDCLDMINASVDQNPVIIKLFSRNHSSKLISFLPMSSHDQTLCYVHKWCLKLVLEVE